MYAVPSDIDSLVNAPSIGLYPDIQAMPEVDLSEASAQMIVCDAVLMAARRQGLRTLDGLSMLVYQGVIGFEIWTVTSSVVGMNRRKV